MQLTINQEFLEWANKQGWSKIGKATWVRGNECLTHNMLFSQFVKTKPTLHTQP